MRIRRHHVGGKAKPRQYADGQPGVVDLPPAMTVAGRARVGVMVVAGERSSCPRVQNLRLIDAVSRRKRWRISFLTAGQGNLGALRVVD